MQTSKEKEIPKELERRLNDPKDIFLKQRLALVTYKSKEKDEDDAVAIAALKEAEKILEESCQLSISNDPETLGLGGAIKKRQHEGTGDIVGTCPP